MGTTSIPTLELADPSGARVTVAPGSLDDRLGDLADALGLDGQGALVLDGRPAACHEPLGRAGVRHGSQLTTATNGRYGLAGSATPVVTVVTEAGPSAGRVVALGPGQHVIGRAPGVDVALADPALEPHHAQLDVDEIGGVRFVQLTGRVAARVDGEPIGSPTAVAVGQRLDLGTSRLRVEPAADGSAADDGRGPAALTADPADPWRRTLHRTPGSQPRCWEPAPIAPPSGPVHRRDSRPATSASPPPLCTFVGSVRRGHA